MLRRAVPGAAGAVWAAKADRRGAICTRRRHLRLGTFVHVLLASPPVWALPARPTTRRPTPSATPSPAHRQDQACRRCRWPGAVGGHQRHHRPAGPTADLARIGACGIAADTSEAGAGAAGRGVPRRRRPSAGAPAGRPGPGHPGHRHPAHPAPGARGHRRRRPWQADRGGRWPADRLAPPGSAALPSAGSTGCCSTWCAATPRPCWATPTPPRRAPERLQGAGLRFADGGRTAQPARPGHRSAAARDARLRPPQAAALAGYLQDTRADAAGAPGPDTLRAGLDARSARAACGTWPPRKLDREHRDGGDAARWGGRRWCRRRRTTEAAPGPGQLRPPTRAAPSSTNELGDSQPGDAAFRASSTYPQAGMTDGDGEAPRLPQAGDRRPATAGPDQRLREAEERPRRSRSPSSAWPAASRAASPRPRTCGSWSPAARRDRGLPDRPGLGPGRPVRPGPRPRRHELRPRGRLPLRRRPTSTPSSSASARARRWPPTPSSGCCWRRPGRRSSAAGIDPDVAARQPTGVYAGSMHHDYGTPLIDAPDDVEGYLLTGNAASVAVRAGSRTPSGWRARRSPWTPRARPRWCALHLAARRCGRASALSRWPAGRR